MHTIRALLIAGAICRPAWADINQDIDRFRDRLPEIKVKETVVNVSPKMRFYLPSGSVDLSLRQEFEKMMMDFSSRYDFVDNSMGFNLEFLYNTALPVSFGVDLNDRVDFNALFANSQYLQRSQSMTPYVQYALGKYARVRSGLKFENTFTDSLSNQLRLDQGRNIVGEIGISRNTLQEVAAYPLGGNESLTLAHSFKNLGSDYSYTQAELNARRFFYFWSRHSVEYQLQAGFPIETENRPLSSVYYAGGYRLLRGYDYKEFRGDALISNSFMYHVPIVECPPEKVLGIPFSIVTLNFFVDSAKIGGRDIYDSFQGFKFSAGMGIGYRVVLLDRFPLQLELSTAKAFDSRSPQFYFTLSTIYYTWKNE